MPSNLALLFVGTGLGAFGGLVFLRESRWWAITAIGLLPMAVILPYAEARLLEYLVRAHLPDFQTALPSVLAADRLHCNSPANLRNTDQCDMYTSLPFVVRALTTNVRVDRFDPPRVFFQFRPGSRQILLYDPKASSPRHGPYRPLGGGWHLSLG